MHKDDLKLFKFFDECWLSWIQYVLIESIWAYSSSEDVYEYNDIVSKLQFAIDNNLAVSTPTLYVGETRVGLAPHLQNDFVDICKTVFKYDENSWRIDMIHNILIGEWSAALELINKIHNS